MRSRRFIPMVEGLSLRLAPSGLVDGGADVSDMSDSSGSGGQGNGPMDLTTDDGGPYTCAVPTDPVDPYGSPE